MPIDELTRELSITVPFGSTQDDAYYDAEHYFLIDPALVPLNESAVECHQGLNSVSGEMTFCANEYHLSFQRPDQEMPMLSCLWRMIPLVVCSTT